MAQPKTLSPPWESDLGPINAHVKFKLSGNLCDPDFGLKDGDARLSPTHTSTSSAAPTERKRLAAERQSERRSNP